MRSTTSSDQQTTTSHNGSSTLLALAAIAERGSEHPLAKAIVNHAQGQGIALSSFADASEFEVTTGRGVTAVYNGLRIKVGSPGFMHEQHEDISSSARSIIERLQGEGKTTILASVDGKIAGIIELLDIPKSGAKEAVSALKSLGVESVMLTGDNERTAKEIAHLVGIERVFANVLPSGKVDVVTTIQKEGRNVAMVGDGINDAPALTAADVGIAIGSGTDVAIEAGKIVLIRDDIRDVVAAVEIAKKTVSRIKQNLIYAFMYNVILIPIAGAGLLYPALAGIAMAASSVSVTTSSLLLKRWSPPSKKRNDYLRKMSP
jgi:P-type Cu+ transporter